MKYKTEIECTSDKIVLDEESKNLIEKAIEAVLFEEQPDFDVFISVLVCDKEEIRSINNEQRGIDKATDVLSFPALEFDENYNLMEEISDYDYDPELEAVYLGDMVLCADVAREQAEEYGHSVDREFAYLTVHSMYHLFGYDHMEENMKADMRKKEETVLKKLGLERK